MPLRLLFTLTLAGLLSAACTLATPSSNKVDEIAGTIPVGGSDYREFDVTKNGELQITITTLTPSPSASLGIALGSPGTASCVLSGNYLAPLVANRPVEFGYFNKGHFCVSLYDTGALTEATAYTGKISHP